MFGYSWEKNNSAEAFCNEFKNMTDGFSENQLFNADETGLYFRMLPQHVVT